MANARNEIYSGIHVLLLVEASEVRVVAMFPRNGMFYPNEDDLLFRRTFKTEHDAIDFLETAKVSYKRCKATGAGILVIVIPKGYTYKSEGGTAFQLMVTMHYEEDSPKFAGNQDWRAYDGQATKKFGLSIESDRVFNSRFALDDELKRLKERFPDSEVSEQIMQSPFRDRVQAGFPYFLAGVWVGCLVGFLY